MRGSVLRVISIVAAFVAPVLLLPEREHQKKFVAFDDRPLVKLKEDKPDFILIGDSILESQINPPILEEYLKPKKPFLLVQYGSGSAFWYLVLKNIVIPSGVRPQRIFIFFRDNYFTLPKIGATGSLKGKVDQFSTADEPVIDSVLYPKTIKEQIFTRITDLFSMRYLRGEVLQGFDSVYPFLAGIPPERTFEVKEKINELFHHENFRRQLFIENVHLQKDEDLDFKMLVSKGFLPSIVELAKANNLNLFFVRMPRHPHKEKPANSERMKKYQKSYIEYLSAEGFGFYDFTEDPELREEMYQADDHIAREYSPEFTRLFVKRLRPFFDDEQKR